MRCEHLQDSGPYVLGALAPSERESYERHLAECSECRHEVADLAELPTLLGRLDLSAAQGIAAGGEDAVRAVLEAMPTSREPGWAGPTAWAGPTVAPAPPPPIAAGDPLVPRLLERTAKQRRVEGRRRRWQAAGALLVAACLGALALFGVSAAFEPRLTDMQAAVTDSPVTASVALKSYAGGTRIWMQCQYHEGVGEDEWSFKLVAVPKSGQPEELAEWTAGAGDEYEMVGHTTLKQSEIARVEIRNTSNETLLTYSPA